MILLYLNKWRENLPNRSYCISTSAQRMEKTRIDQDDITARYRQHEASKEVGLGMRIKDEAKREEESRPRIR